MNNLHTHNIRTHQYSHQILKTLSLKWITFNRREKAVSEEQLWTISSEMQFKQPSLCLLIQFKCVQMNEVQACCLCLLSPHSEPPDPGYSPCKCVATNNWKCNDILKTLYISPGWLFSCILIRNLNVTKKQRRKITKYIHASFSTCTLFAYFYFRFFLH